MSMYGKMWERVMSGQCKQHNEQMFVVAALWDGGLLVWPVNPQ